MNNNFGESKCVPCPEQASNCEECPTEQISNVTTLYQQRDHAKALYVKAIEKVCELKSKVSQLEAQLEVTDSLARDLSQRAEKFKVGLESFQGSFYRETQKTKKLQADLDLMSETAKDAFLDGRKNGLGEATSIVMNCFWQGKCLGVTQANYEKIACAISEAAASV